MACMNTSEQKITFLVKHFRNVARPNVSAPFFYVRSLNERSSWKYRHDVIEPSSRFEKFDTFALSELTTHFIALDLFPESEFFGFMHYRRFFDLAYLANVRVSQSTNSVNRRLKQKELEEALLHALDGLCLEKNTLIVPNPLSLNDHRYGPSKSVYDHVIKSYNDLLPLLNQSLNLLDSELGQKKDTSKELLQNTTYGYYNNMFVAHRSFVEDYDRIFFSIFEKLSNYSIQNNLAPQSDKRWFGYIAELLFTCYVDFIRKNLSLNIIECPILTFEPRNRVAKTLRSVIRLKRKIVSKELLPDTYLDWTYLGKK